MSTSSNIFDESPHNEEDEALDDEEFSTNNIRVLLVDADCNFLTLMTNFSYQVTTCLNGEEAIGFLRKSKHEIDLVIWDFHMPQINVPDALNIITKELNLPVVIISNDNKKETVMKSMTCGACDFLLKPLSQEVVSVLWRHVYRKRMILNSGLVKPNRVEPEIEESDHDGQGYEEGPKRKKPRLSWTPELHRDFEVAYKVQHRKSKAIPMEILKYMKEELHVPQRLTRSNVASHLQKYRQNLGKRIRTDSDVEETLEDLGSRNAGPNGPTIRASAGESCGPTNEPNAGPSTWSTFCWVSSGPSYVHGASNMFLNSNVNPYGGGMYVMNDPAVMNGPVQYAPTTYEPMVNEPVNSLLEQMQQQQYSLQLPNTVQAKEEAQRVPSVVLENPVQLIYNSSILPEDFTEYLQEFDSNLDQTPQNC